MPVGPTCVSLPCASTPVERACSNFNKSTICQLNTRCLAVSQSTIIVHKAQILHLDSTCSSIAVKSTYRLNPTERWLLNSFLAFWFVIFLFCVSDARPSLAFHCAPKLPEELYCAVHNLTPGVRCSQRPLNCRPAIFAKFPNTFSRSVSIDRG